MRININKVKEVIEATNPQTAMLYCLIADANGCTSARLLANDMKQSKRNINYMLSELEACNFIYKLDKGYRVL